MRRAVAAASTIHAALLCLVPLAQLARAAGVDCASSSLLFGAAPLLSGWIVYAALSYRMSLAERPQFAAPVNR